MIKKTMIFIYFISKSHNNWLKSDWQIRCANCGVCWLGPIISKRIPPCGSDGSHVLTKDDEK